MSQADTDAPTDNVARFPGPTPEPQPRPGGRSKDRRAAARQAKRRSNIKAGRDAKPDKDALVYAPPIAPIATQAERDAVTLPAPVTPPEWRTMAPVERPAQRHGGAVDVAA